MPRPRAILPPSILAAAALLGACQAPVQGEAASIRPAATGPAEQHPAKAEGLTAPAEPAADLAPRPVSRVLLGGGLVVEDVKIGEGPLCDGPDSTISVRYRGTLASTGEVFDGTGPGETAEFPLDRLIKGWRDGVPGMRVGGVRRLSVPAALAYGERGLVQGDDVVIPPRADLVFEIELLGVR